MNTPAIHTVEIPAHIADASMKLGKWVGNFKSLRDENDLEVLKKIAQYATKQRMRLADPRPEIQHSRVHWTRRARQIRRELAHNHISPALKLLQANDIMTAELVHDHVLAASPRAHHPTLNAFDKAYCEQRNKYNHAGWARVLLDTAGMDLTFPDKVKLTDILDATMLHVSEDDENKVAYSANLADIARDRQTRTTLGRFLMKYVGPKGKTPLLTEAQIKTLAERHGKRVVDESEVQFIESTDPDGWEHVYDTGPASCMRGNSSVRIYARPGNHLRLAYLERDEQIIARSIVREDRKEYIRVYPNPGEGAQAMEYHTQFRATLERMGYSHGDMDGIKLHLKWDFGRIVAPYVDGCVDHADIDHDDRGEHLLICEDGGIGLTNTGGFADGDGDNEYMRECDECGDDYDSQDGGTYSEYHSLDLCDHCASHHFITAIVNRRGYEDLVRRSDAIQCESNDMYYAVDCTSECDVYQCAVTDDWYKIDDLVCCDIGDHAGDLIYVDEARQDCITDEWAEADEFTETTDGWVHDDYVEECCITGESRHEQRMISVRVGKTILFFDPEKVTLDELRMKFLVCGKPGKPGILVPRGYYGRELDASVYWNTPTNITEGDDVQMNFDDIVYDLDGTSEIPEPPVGSRFAWRGIPAHPVLALTYQG